MNIKNKTDSSISATVVCGKSLDGFINEIENFHGFLAPGVVLGGFMVDLAMELIGPDVETDAIVETYHCLPDAVQIFTPCTFGNGWLKVLDWDKFALSLYDRRELTGYRVWLDLSKAHLFPNIYDWYMRQVPKRELPLEGIIESVLHARRSVLSYRPIFITHYYKRKKKGMIEICSRCGEAYGSNQGSRCIACQDEGYYRSTVEGGQGIGRWM